jgi:hypothetical protein
MTGRLQEARMASNEKWARIARSTLKAELKRHEISYRELAGRLTNDGSPETEASVTNKIARGTFTAAFMLQCMSLIGVTAIRTE